MSWEQAEIRELKVNRYVVIDEEPCRIISIQMSKPGKHGEAKARLEVVGLFDRSEEHTSELQSQSNLVCRLLLEKKTNSTTARKRERASPRSSGTPSPRGRVHWTITI